MGGPPPLGYDVADRKLVVNSEEAKRVGHIFERYIALKSTTLLKDELNRYKFKTKNYISRTGKPVGGQPFSTNTLLTLLRSRDIFGSQILRGNQPGNRRT
jgi:hypothetical protein